MHRVAIIFLEWLCREDERYASLFKHGHWLFYAGEYVLLPLLLFFLIFRMIRKEKRSATFVGVSRLREIIARNWLELTLTFLLSWLAFELRINCSDVVHAESISTNGVVSLPVVSLGIFLCLFLLYSGYLTVLRNHKESPSTVGLQMSFAPIVILLQLALNSCIYYLPIIRIAVTCIGLCCAVIYTRRKRYAPEFAWETANEYKRKGDDDFEFAIKAVKWYLLSAEAIEFKANFNRKANNFFHANRECKRVIEKYKIGRENTQLAHVVDALTHKNIKYQKYALKIENRNLYNMLKNALAELNEALYSL